MEDVLENMQTTNANDILYYEIIFKQEDRLKIGIQDQNDIN